MAGKAVGRFAFEMRIKFASVSKTNPSTSLAGRCLLENNQF